MELKLKNKLCEYMGAAHRVSFTHEVTSESVIPDSLPDAQRVITTDAMVYIRGKETDSGRVTVTGVVDASIIYADEEGRLKRTELQLPFSVGSENDAIPDDGVTVVDLRLSSADTRLLNPRKLLVRCDVLIDLVCCDRRSVTLYGSPEEPEDQVQLLCESREVTLLSDVTEKTFLIAEEYSLPAAKPPVGEVLKSKVELELGEVNAAGGKAIIKGSARAQILYRPERGGAPVAAEFTTVFSQAMDLEGQPDAAELRAMLTPTAVYFNTDGLFAADDRRISMEANVVAQCLVYRRERLEYITDAYSCGWELTSKSAEETISTTLEPWEASSLVRDSVELTRQPESVISVSADPGIVYKSRNGDSYELKSTVNVNIIYMSEDGVLLSAVKKVPVSASMPAPSDADYSIILTVQGAPYAVVTATGVEVKFNVRFTAQGIKNETVTGLSAISIDTSNPKDQTSLPSIVLKRFAAGDTLWLLAKRYCSAEELIRAANGLEGDAVPQIGEMVIIPKKR